MATKKRLIDANGSKKAILAEPWKDKQNAVRLTVDYINIIIDEQPTVDAVEVVRCKDCKHWHEGTGWCNKHSYFIGSNGEACNPWESPNWKMLNADDFCSYGERKDNVL